MADVGAGAAGAAMAAATVAAAGLDYKAAQEANATALKQREESQKFIEKQTNQARGDIFQLFPAGQQARQQGIQSGFDIYKAALPTQTQYFQQGNVMAQNQQLAGLGQIQNAILGRPINQNALKAGVVQQMDYNANGGLDRFRPVNSAPLTPLGSSGFTISPYTAPNSNVVNNVSTNTGNNNTTKAPLASDAEIQNWFKKNPNATDSDIFSVMNQYQVSPARLSSVMGFNPSVVDSRYAAQGSAASSMPVVNNGGGIQQYTPEVTSIPMGTNGGGIQQYGSYVPDNPDWQYTPEGMAYYGFTG